MEKPSSRRKPELPGNVRVPDSAFKRVRMSHNVDAVVPITPQAAPKLFKSVTVNKESTRV